jgi:hypothetical protein
MNAATGSYSFAAGGDRNAATGAYSFAAGRLANANFDGCFVWADSTSASTTLNCSGANRWVVRASGGTWFYSNAAQTSGVKLSAGAGAWAAISDRDAKQGFSPVEPEEVLRRVVKMPISTWSYKSEQGVKHMGPMAQDFHAAFGLGTDERSIVTIDADGVALAAIQGLNQKLTRLEQRNDELASVNRELRERLDRLEAGGTRSASMPHGGAGLAALGIGLAGAVVVARGRRRGSGSPKPLA